MYSKDFLLMVVSECANCKKAFKDDTEKYTTLNPEGTDLGDKDISVIEALSYIYGMPINTINLNLKNFGELVTSDFMSNLHQNNLSADLPKNHRHYELALCSICSHILVQMCTVHGNFNKNSKENSIISTAICNKHLDIKSEDEPGAENQFLPNSNYWKRRRELQIKEEPENAQFDPNFSPSPSWGNDEMDVDPPSSPDPSSSLVPFTSPVALRSPTTFSSPGSLNLPSNVNDPQLVIQVKKMKSFTNSLRCLSCNLTFESYSDFKMHENTECFDKKTAYSSKSDAQEQQMREHGTPVSVKKSKIKTFKKSMRVLKDDIVRKSKSSLLSRNAARALRYKSRKSSSKISDEAEVVENTNLEILLSDDIVFFAECFDFLEIKEGKDKELTCLKCQESYGVICLLTDNYSKCVAQEKSLVFCFDCRIVFRRVESFRRHCRKIHYEKYAPCQKQSGELGDQPGQEKSNKDNENAQVSQVTQPSSNKGPFVCKTCELAFKQFDLLSKHVNEIHGTSQSPIYQTDVFRILCSKLNMCFDKWTSLVSHSEECRQDVPKFQCKICKEDFSTLSTFFCHMAAKHENSLPSNNLKAKPICITCLKSFNNRHELNVHMNRKKQKPDADTSVPCPVCNVVCKHKNSLRCHMKFFHREILNLPPIELLHCPVENCGKSFSFKKDLRVHHESVHKGNTPRVTCKICKRVYKGTSLTFHMRAAHTGIKPYKCSVCDMAFTSSSILLKHESTHSDARPFPCEICGKCFKMKWEVVNHVRLTHEMRQLYICDLCGVTVKRRQHFVAHMRDHEDKEKGLDAKCKDCGKVFEVPSQLKRHAYMSHNPDREPILCPICGKRFRSNYHLKRHVTSVHEKDKKE